MLMDEDRGFPFPIFGDLEDEMSYEVLVQSLTVRRKVPAQMREQKVKDLAVAGLKKMIRTRING